MTIIKYYKDIRTFTTALALLFQYSSNDNNDNNDNDLIFMKLTNDIDNNFFSLKSCKGKNNFLQLEYKLNEDNLKINYLEINNDYYSKLFNQPTILTNDEYIMIKKAIINYIELIAINNGKTKIVIDIHHNLNRYNHDLKEMGFIITNRNCFDNSFWFEAEKQI